MTPIRLIGSGVVRVKCLTGFAQLLRAILGGLLLRYRNDDELKKRYSAAFSHQSILSFITLIFAA